MKKLTVKDLILTGVLTALMWIICMLISSVMSMLGPATNVFYPAIVAIPNGIVMMLLLAKVPKRGVFLISGAVQAALFLLVGAFWMIPIALVVGGLICDFIMMRRNEITMKSMALAYAVFNGIFALGAIGPVKFLQATYVKACLKNNLPQEYIDGLIRMTSVPMLLVIVLCAIICGFLGAYLGQRMLNKHFIKAGLVKATK